MADFSYLKSMQDSDLPWVLSLEQRSYNFPWSEKGFENSLEQGLNYIFCNAQGGKLGYCCILPVLDEVHVLNICVVPEYQKKGIAKDALKKMLVKLKDSRYRVALLEVRGTNLPAIKLYQSLGFHKDGVRKNYYRVNHWDETQQVLIEGKEDAVLMSFLLAGM